MKSTKDLECNQAKYELKFAVARRYCEQRGWTFRIITEKEIRTPRLANVKFVRAYETQQHPQEMIDDVLRHMAVAAHTDSEQLLRSLAPDVG